MSVGFFPLGHRRPPVVLGYQLKEFTLGHWYYLTELGSPFFKKNTKPTAGDFFLAVWICAQDYAESRRTLDKWWIPLIFKLWGFRSRKLNAPSEYTKFHSYLNSAFLTPETLGKGEGKITSPTVCAVMAYVCLKLNTPYLQALDMPVNMALHLQLACSDIEGDLKLWDDRLETMWDEAQKMGEELKRN